MSRSELIDEMRRVLSDRSSQAEEAQLPREGLYTVTSAERTGHEPDRTGEGKPLQHRPLQTREELQRAYDELEKRVSRRTEQLAKTIDALQKEIYSRRETEKALRDSEERYALAAQGANDGIWDADLNTGDLYLSPRWKGMLGYEDGELPNDSSTWKSRIHPDDFEKVMEHRDAYLAGKIPFYQIEYRLRHRDGSYRWILTRGACLRDADGVPHRLAGSHTDTTERKVAEQKILRLNHLYAVLSETNKAIVRSGDRETLFSAVCQVAVDHGGFQMAWIGIHDPVTGRVNAVASAGFGSELLEQIRVTAYDEPEGRGLVGLAIRHGGYHYTNDFLSDPRTVPWQRQAEQYGLLSAAAVALKLDGEVVGILSLYAGERNFFDPQLIELIQEMAADISFALDRFKREHNHRQAQIELQRETAARLQAMEALREREQMLMQQSRLAAIGEMIGNIAHQWRQPLNTLGLYLQGLGVTWDMGGFDRQHAEETIRKSMQVIFHMSQTIDDFRYFFKPDKEKISFQVRELVAKTVSLIEGSYKDQHIDLRVTAEDDSTLVGYPNEYSQVLLNILSNARDALIERRVPAPRVAVRLFKENHKSVVTVTDNAGGIPEGIMNKIFDPYFTTKDPDKGTGVGLFISKTIIEKNMGGRLTVRNTGDGAEFRIEV
ncbi:PAS domain-containing protein [Geobacter sp. DSM 9736]|uniref:PAS domain-containing protein n=1 Tax=Geobacter sp. DSM 9736 TaxID=1277350 RepID=UPI0012FE7514|nr:PAS domain-containing protein [Geobacter sp. DSM 9736]